MCLSDNKGTITGVLLNLICLLVPYFETGSYEVAQIDFDPPASAFQVQDYRCVPLSLAFELMF